jgi:hypothetical protein
MDIFVPDVAPNVLLITVKDPSPVHIGEDQLEPTAPSARLKLSSIRVVIDAI